jgi:threonine aldolase
MISFLNDYNTGAHPALLQALTETNLVPTPGYGTDDFSERACKKIREACGDDCADIFFISGGTQTNAVMISALLAPYGGVIAANSAHIAVHEAGAIEATGHKVITVPAVDGKLTLENLNAAFDAYYNDGSPDHMVYPGAVFISHPSETGSLYSLAELEALSEKCRRMNAPLYLDGARLAYGLASPDTDITLKDITRLCDAFYIGGTKCGALCGEAAVFPRATSPVHFITHVKRMGALMAKGRLLGVQFDALFTNNLYGEIGATGMKRAAELKRIFEEAGVEFYCESPTNQQFVILPNDVIEELSQHVAFGKWADVDDAHTAVRFVTSWSTTEEDLQALKDLLSRFLK